MNRTALETSHLESDNSKLKTYATPGGVQNSKLLQGLVLVGLAGVSYGFQAILGKWAYANGANVVTLLLLRSIIASLVLWLLVAYFRLNIKISPSNLAGLVLLGLVFVGSAAGYFVALQKIEVGTAVLVVYIFPALVVIGAAIFFKEKLTPGRIMALLLALVGCALTIDPFYTLSSSQKFDWLGIGFALISAFCNAAYSLLAVKFGRGIPGLVAAAYSIPVNALIYLLWCLVGGGFLFDMSLAGWLLCMTLGCFTGLSWALYFIGLPHIGASRASIVITLEPATAVVLGIFLLGEPLSLIKLLGGALIFAALYLLRK